MGRSYLYGIVEGTSETMLRIPGVGGASPVHIMAGDGLGCVVSDYGKEDLAALPKEDLVRSLLAHQQVVEHVMQGHTVLPVKFGTLLDSAAEVADLLSQGHLQLVSAMASIRGKVEIEVAATWDTGRVLREISKEEEVVRAREALARKGQPTVEERMQLGQMVKAYMDRRRDTYRERMVSFLTPLSVDVTPNVLVSDEMVINVAFLVERARHHEFDAAVHQLDELFQNEIAFRVIGPLPPYSFSTVEVTRLTSEEVEEARQTLHLRYAISESEVRKAYRRLASAGQRNLIAGDKSARGQLTRPKQAEELLVCYCQAGSRNREDGLGLGPTGQDIISLLVVAVKGSRSDEVETAQFSAVARG